jgi:hypothetical protein
MFDHETVFSGTFVKSSQIKTDQLLIVAFLAFASSDDVILSIKEI